MLVRVLGAVVVVLALGGCGSAVTPPPVAPPNPFPARPMSIDLSGVDLCATLTDEQKRVRAIDDEFENTAEVAGKPSPGCLWGSSRTQIGYTVQIIEAPATVAWTPGESRLVVIDGYGAVRAPDDVDNSPGRDPFCQLPLDVSDNQTVRVQVTGSPDADGGDPAAVEAACDRAVGFARDVLGNLRR
ncbi:DUF3558 family protein [Pseudonocardia spirodelae]|uniref:DUF3558 family protein n=1 Tax=Pseudonocardia spirodelae TaxID=3133431 RepID=A0ABU8T758_9PSEU